MVDGPVNRRQDPAKAALEATGRKPGPDPATEMLTGNLTGLRAYAEQLQQQLGKLRSGGLAEMRQEMNAVKGTAKSPDGFVTATVGPRGQLTELKLDPRIYRNPDSAKLAATITETIQKAAEQSGERVSEITERFAPGMDIGSATRGEFTSRSDRFDFIRDRMPGGAD